MNEVLEKNFGCKMFLVRTGFHNNKQCLGHRWENDRGKQSKQVDLPRNSRISVSGSLLKAGVRLGEAGRTCLTS